MGDLFKVVADLIGLITPETEFNDIRLERKQLRLELKKLRIAKKMYKQIYKEFKKDGFTEEENASLESLKTRIKDRKLELI